MTTAQAIQQIFGELIGHELHAGHHRDDDVRTPGINPFGPGALLKWRDHDWFTTATNVQVHPVAEDLFRVAIRYSWHKKTQYFAAPGVKTRDDENAGGTG